MLPNRSVVLVCRPSDRRDAAVYITGPGQSPEFVQSVLEALHVLIERLNLLTLPEHDVERVFPADGIDSPSVHVRLALADGVQWRSRYKADQVPEVIRDLLSGAQAIGVERIVNSPRRRIRAVEAMRIIGLRQQM